MTGVQTCALPIYEVGKREPDFETEERIADFFNIDLNTLRGRNTELDITPLDPDIRRIQRARKNMPEQDKNFMMEMLERSFKAYFEDDGSDDPD